VKYSVEQEIKRYPVGVVTTAPPEVVDGNSFYVYDIGGRYIWRTHDLVLEVGQIGAVFYGKVYFRILEGIFLTPRAAMRQCSVIKTMFLNNEIASPFPVAVPYA
jgi:hypothetical protein